MLKIRKSVEYHGHRVATMMGWRSRITIMLVCINETKGLHGIERVPQCGYITLITMYLHQNNSDRVYGIDKNNRGNDTTGCTQVILRHNRVLLFIQLE